jgi:transcriptional regulator with XRE-family HTH domain
MAPTEHIGARIRYWRRRRGGMTQAALAGLAGLSQSYVSQIESGARSVDRRSTLVALANALQVTANDLLDQPGDAAESSHSGITTVPALRVALIEIEEGDVRTPGRSREQLAVDVADATRVRARGDYAQLARVLPDLVADAGGYGGTILAQVAYTASSCLRHLGYRDLARSAARIALEAAQEAGDPAWIGAARFAGAHAMPFEASGTMTRVTERALGELQAAASDVATRQMLGQLHLTAAFAAATANRPDDAAAHVRAAEDEAATLGDPEDGYGFNISCFGPTNIGVWRMALAAELGEYGKVIEIGRTVDPAPLGTANRHQAYWLDLGRALAHSGRHDAEARQAFARAEQAAPVPFSLNTIAHDCVLMMVNRARRGAVPRDLRVLASRLGIDVVTGG